MASNYLQIYFAGLLWFTACMIIGCESSNLYRYNHYMTVKNYESAKELMQEDVAQNPYSPESHLLLGKAHLMLREYEEARAAFNDSRYTSSEYTSQIQLLMERQYRREFKAGVKAMEKEKYNKSISYFEKALEIEPDSHEIYPVMGYSFYKLEKYDEAYHSYQQATVLNESDAPSFHALSELALKNKDVSEAKRYALTATEIDSSYLPAHETLVYIGLQLEEYELAEQSFQAIPEEERSFKLSRDFVFELFTQGEIERSLPHMEKLSMHNQSDEIIRQTLAETYHYLNQYDKMAEAYEAIWQQNPNDKDALVNIIKAYEMMNSQELANEYKERLNQQGSDSLTNL